MFLAHVVSEIGFVSEFHIAQVALELLNTSVPRHMTSQYGLGRKALIAHRASIFINALMQPQVVM